MRSFVVPSALPSRWGGRLGQGAYRLYLRLRRLLLLGAAGMLAAAVLGFGALVGIIFVPTHFPATQPVTSPNPHVKHFYLALGDSLAFGYQPNFDWDQGYSSQWWDELQRHGSKSYFDYGCNGVTSSQFISGDCPAKRILHSYYDGSQLAAAVAFIKGHAGQVGPVSLDVGADDVLPDINSSTCQVDDAKWHHDLATLDENLTQHILPQLTSALRGTAGPSGGQLVMMNYYDPFETNCPNAHPYMVQLNQHLAADAARFHVPVANVYAAFGGFSGPAHPNPHLCDYTWICQSGRLHDIHPTTRGYGVITDAFEQLTGY